MAHIDAGKTTLPKESFFIPGVRIRSERFMMGRPRWTGMKQERERGITITSAATTCFWRDHRITIIDTPGHVDFTAR